MIVRKPTELITTGDVVIFDGQPHLITSTDTRNGLGWPVARGDDGWTITLEPGQSLDVAS